MGIRMPTHRAVVRITWSGRCKAPSPAQCGAGPSQPSAVSPIGGPSSQLSPLCDGQLTTSISFQKQVFIKTSQGPWWKWYPSRPRNKYSRSHLTTAPLRRLGSLKWHVGSKMNNINFCRPAPPCPQALRLPALPLGHMLPSARPETVITVISHSFLLNPFLKDSQFLKY